MDRLHLLTKLRRHGVETAALILSALGNPADRLEGLDAGAENYLAKPFDVDELLARLRALRRRHSTTASTLRILGGHFDLESRSVTRPDGSVVVLSERESGLLEELARWPNRVFGRDEILEIAASVLLIVSTSQASAAQRLLPTATEHVDSVQDAPAGTRLAISSQAAGWSRRYSIAMRIRRSWTGWALLSC
jgi:response regulator RpfG family c-di-GMP phosphodiesterase